MGGSKALKDEAANTGKTGGAPAAADGETGVGGDGGEGDQTSLLAGGVEGSDGKKKGVKVGKGGMSLLRGSSGDEKKKKKKLSFAERVELQNQKDEATKKKKQEAEMKRLKKLKDMQDERERIRKEKAEALRKKEEYDPEIYEEASSDPYIVFSIDPPTNPGCKVWRTGGYFGRTVRTDMVTNTLNPSFEEARRPLAYLGTRSELENEILRVRVYDWDFFSADDLIGQADVPLNGLLEYGQVEVELTLDLPDTTQKKVRGKHPKKTVPAGRLSGQILFEGRLPAYNQLGGGMVERKHGVVYLAVRLQNASKLLAADANNASDPFVTVDWDGMQQTTKVISRTLEPVWNQTLLFPLKLVTLNKQALASKPPVSIRVFDHDEAGHDLLGSTEVPLHKITSAEHAKLDDEIVDGKVYKGRVLKLENHPIQMPGLKLQSTINALLYFAPDLPAEVMLEEQAERRAQALSDEYMARLKTFYASLPGRIRTQLEQAMLIEFGRGPDYELGWEQQKRIVSAEDQDAIEHFFSEYLSPQQPPSEMREPMQVARMVRCITWEADTEIFKKETRRDVWQSPTFFLEMRKGDFEDHALLMCNLFLGLELDAYVCVGRLIEGSGEGEKRHVWVMTREPNGDVGLWETSMGTCVKMMDRWQGVQLSAQEKAALEAETAKVNRGANVGGKADKMFSALRKGAAALGDAADGAPEQAEAMPDPNEEIAGNLDIHLLSSAEEMLTEMATETLLSRDEVEQSLTEVVWMADDGEESEAAVQRQQADAKISAEKEELNTLRRSAEAEVEISEEALEAELGRMPPPEGALLYSSIECVFNHKNLWISRTVLDPARIKYDFEDPKYWTSFIEPRMTSQGLPKAFYSPQRLGPKTPPDRLKSMEAQIEGELKSQIKLARSTGLVTIINKSADLVDTLRRGLELQEKARTGEAQARADLKPWQKDVRSRLPAGSTFKGRAFHFAFTDPKRIRKNLLSSVDYQEDSGDGTEFAVAVKVFGFHGGICSVWVYYGLIDTNLLG